MKIFIKTATNGAARAVERYFNKLKQYRRVATRYEKTAISFAGFIYLASTMILLL